MSSPSVPVDWSCVLWRIPNSCDSFKLDKDGTIGNNFPEHCQLVCIEWHLAWKQ
nr:hypothetical protein Iba_chr14eCG5670 [Ipomoea batatas]